VRSSSAKKNRKQAEENEMQGRSQKMGIGSDDLSSGCLQCDENRANPGSHARRATGITGREIILRIYKTRGLLRGFFELITEIKKHLLLSEKPRPSRDHFAIPVPLEILHTSQY
jgi:hypothetical protein